MPDVNILYIIIAILSGYILLGKRKLSIPFDNYNCKDIIHNKGAREMEMYCTSKTCPMLQNCKRNRQYMRSSMDSYTDYSEHVTVGIKGYECEMFIGMAWIPRTADQCDTTGT